MKRPRPGHALTIAATVLLLAPSVVLTENDTWYVAAVAADDHGGAYAAGGITEGRISGVFQPSFVTRLDRFGNRMWTRMLAQDSSPSFGPAATVRDAAATADGVVIVGRGVVGPFPPVQWIENYDALGNLKWKRQYAFGEFRGVAVDPSGNIYAAGSLAAPKPHSDAFVIKWDAAGDVLWTRRLRNPCCYPFFAFSASGIAVSPHETIYIVGQMGVGLPPNRPVPSGFVSALDADGNELWSHYVDAIFTRAAAGLGTVYAVNATSLRRYDGAGVELWRMSPVATAIADVAIDESDNAYFAGWLNEAVFVESVDLNAIQRWRLQFDAGVGAYVGSIARNRDNEVFVGGAGTFRSQPAAGFVAKIGFGSTVVEVSIDIRPGSETNPVNLTSRGVVPVAIRTAGGFDATTVLPSSVCFGDQEDAGQRDCTETHGVGHLEDVDGDGDLDLLLHYETPATGIDGGDTGACLSGETQDGATITGCDRVSVR
jgi:hypothetical protein